MRENRSSGVTREGVAGLNGPSPLLYRFLRAMVRWPLSVMVFAMFFAFLAIFAVNLRCALGADEVRLFDRPYGQSDPKTPPVTQP